MLRLLLQPRVQRSSALKRYTVFAILLGCGVSAELVGGVMALVGKQAGLAALFLVTAMLLSAACFLEMRKLSRKM